MTKWGSKLLRSERGEHLRTVRELLRTPVVVDLADHDQVDAVAMIVAATGRELLRADQAESRFPNGGHKRLRRVDDSMLATLSEPVSAGGGLELAERLGTIDTPRIHVHGVQGGVGASSLAVHLAVALASSLIQDATPVALIDTDPHSVGLDLLFGWETVPGRRLGGQGLAGPNDSWPQVPGCEALEFRSRDHREAAAGCAVACSGEAVFGEGELAPGAIAVADCGRLNPVAHATGGAGKPADLVVCVAQPSLAGVHALRRHLDSLAAAEVPAVGVLREDAGEAAPIALREMLGTAPVELWPWDEAVAAERLYGWAGEVSAGDLRLAASVLSHLPGAEAKGWV